VYTVPNRIVKYRVLAKICGCLVRRDIGKNERVEGQEFLHTAEGLTGYLSSATVLRAEKSQEAFTSPNSFKIVNLEKE
jgi:hypothetical protein